MTFPTVASITATTFAIADTSHDVAMPATVAAGDLLVIWFTNDQSSSLTTPSGWTKLSDTRVVAQVRNAVFIKKADGSEGGTTVDVVTSSSRQAVAQVYRVLAAEWSGTLAEVLGTPVDSGATGTDDSPDPPSLTATGGADDYLWIAGTGFDADVTVSAYPTNYTNGTFSTTSDATNGCGMGTCRRELNAPSEDPAVFTLSGPEQWVANTILIPPPNPPAVTTMRSTRSPRFGLTRLARR